MLDFITMTPSLLFFPSTHAIISCWLFIFLRYAYSHKHAPLPHIHSLFTHKTSIPPHKHARTGVVHLTALTKKGGYADSAPVNAKFTLHPKTKTPEIRPFGSVFAISATLVFSCETANATIFFTTDGSDPTPTSLIVESGNSVLRFTLFCFFIFLNFLGKILFFARLFIVLHVLLNKIQFCC